MTGTLAEKVERDVRAYPDDYRATGQWLDEFCSLKQHDSRLKGKLLLKKKEFDESGIQKEATKFKRKARTAGTKKARETAKKAAKKVGQRCQSRKDDLTKLKKQIKAVDAYLKTPKGELPVTKFVLIREALEYAFSEDPQDIKKFLVIFWVLTDRFVDTTGPGLTRFEKWNYGDNRACADPEEQAGTRHWTLDWLLSIFDQMIPTVEAAMHVRNKETGCEHSGDFTSVIWYGKKYSFTKTQAECIKYLWEEWEKGGLSLSEKTIGELIDSASDNYRLMHTFNRGKHPAWGSMITSVGKGIFALRKP